jgi:hypothetical protein
MINGKYVPPHCRFSKEELEKKEVKEIKEVVASVKSKEQKPLVKTKKMTKPKNKPAPKPKMVQKWVPKIATLEKSIDPKQTSEEV